MDSSQEETFITACTGCGKKYRLPKRVLGRQVQCKACQTVWRAVPCPDQSPSTEASQLTDAASSQLAGTASGGNSALNESSIDDDSAWIGKKLGRFQVVEVLGKGAMGIVFRAHDPDLKIDVALKILGKQFIRSKKTTYRLEQFIREARSAARLSHPNSVIVHQLGQDQGWYFIAMELIEGKTLLDLVRRQKKKVPIDQACELIAQAADALSAAHRLGIIHRDIKPSNIMLTREGRVKVADFGLAQFEDAGDDFELPTKAVGTPYWMSPEQCRNQTAIPQSDIYALGALLFFTLTGEVPFRGDNKREILNQHLNAPLPDPKKYRAEIPDSLVRIIQRAMAKNPAERYQDAAEMAIGLRHVVNAIAQSRMAERYGGLFGYSAGPQPMMRGSSGRFRNIVLIIVPIALILGTVFWFARSCSSPPRPPIIQPTSQDTGPMVPVFAIKGELRYHALGCPVISDVPTSSLTRFNSDKEAEAQNLVGCTYCQDLLRIQKENAATQPAGTPTPKP